MADLSSCYFCGAAMDVSLREYPVVPAALDPTPDQQTTVVLCGTCERKLAHVVDPVVDAAENAAVRGDDADVTAAPSGDASATEDGVAGGGDGPTPVVPPSVLDADQDATDGDDVDAAGENADDGTPFEVDDTTSVFDDPEPDAAADSVFGDAATTIPDAETSEDDDADGIAFDEGTPNRDARTSRSTTAESESERERRRKQRERRRRERERQTQQSQNASNATQNATTTTQNATTTNTSENAADATASSSDSENATNPATDVDPRTYNKVVRLMKNRDFPVARDEIEAIAGSAYDIPDHECEAIVDAAIQRGLVSERNGQLTHPDGV